MRFLFHNLLVPVHDVNAGVKVALVVDLAALEVADGCRRGVVDSHCLDGVGLGLLEVDGVGATLGSVETEEVGVGPCLRQ